MADDPLAQAVARVQDNLCEMTLRCDWGDHTVEPADLRLILLALHAAREDAARLDWMQGRYVATDFDYTINEESACVLLVEIPHFTKCGPDLRKTIDAARAANKEGA